MICANPDLVVQRGERLIYCGGALAELYEFLGGRAIMAGKPHAPIYDLALEAGNARGGAPSIAGEFWRSEMVSPQTSPGPRRRSWTHSSSPRAFTALNSLEPTEG